MIKQQIFLWFCICFLLFADTIGYVKDTYAVNFMKNYLQFVR